MTTASGPSAPGTGRGSPEGRGRPLLRLLLPLLLLVPWGGVQPGEARQTTALRLGGIRGTVFDSTRAAPLSGARVVLWNTVHEARTDDLGSFHLVDVPEGVYELVYFHHRLTGLGIASGAHEVRVRADSLATVALGTPSMPTIQSTLCLLDEGPIPPQGSGPLRAVGQIVDGMSGLPVPAVPVEASWSPAGPGLPGTLTSLTDEEGWYRLCGLPTGIEVAIRATAGERSSPRRIVGGPPATLVILDLELADAVPSVLQGTVLAGGGSQADPLPLSGATAHLRGTGYRTVTDPSGRFRFADLPAGEYVLELLHPRFAPRADRVRIDPDTDVRVVGILTRPAIPLPPLEVTVRSSFEGRALALGGRRISRDDIERVRPRSRDAADLLHHQQVPGIVVKRGTGMNRSCVEYVQGASRIFRTTCESVQVYVDNVRSVDPQGAVEIPADVVDRMILFRPVEAGNLFGVGAGSGVLMIFTKGGGRL